MVVIVTWRIKCHSRLASRWWYCARQLLIWSQWYLSLLAPLAISPHHTDILSLVPRPVTSVAGQKLPNLPFIRKQSIIVRDISESQCRTNTLRCFEPAKKKREQTRSTSSTWKQRADRLWVNPFFPNASKCVKCTKAAASRVKAEDHISIKMWSARSKDCKVSDSPNRIKHDQTIHVRHARLTWRHRHAITMACLFNFSVWRVCKDQSPQSELP